MITSVVRDGDELWKNWRNKGKMKLALAEFDLLIVLQRIVLYEVKLKNS